MSHAVGVSPLTVILGILIGSIVYGPVGAFLAVPIAAAVQVILEEIVPTLQPDTGANVQDTTKVASADGSSGAVASVARRPSSPLLRASA